MASHGSALGIVGAADAVSPALHSAMKSDVLDVASQQRVAVAVGVSASDQSQHFTRGPGAQRRAEHRITQGDCRCPGLASLVVIRIDSSLASCSDAYVAGWALSRGAPAPQEAELGWYVPTRTTTEPERYVLTSGTLEQVRRLRDTMTLPGSCVKFAGQRETWLSLAHDGWAENPVGWFMTRGIEATRMVPARPAGCTAETGVHDRLVSVTVHVDGQQIASGRAGLVGAWAVPDRISTATAYQRRGLGRLVMHHLLRLAWEAGARRAVLDASPQGRELYLSLGWLTVAGQFGIHRTEPAPACPADGTIPAR